MSSISALVKKTKCNMVNTSVIIRSQSSFKVAFILVFSMSLEIGLLVLFFKGFQFLEILGGVGIIVINHLFSMFFLGMGIMLVASSIVTSYSTIFRSDEIPFLMVRPFSVSQIVSYKFLQSALLSSWAFPFIIIPFIGAYALHQKLSLLFVLWTFLFSLPFLILCSGIGTIISIFFTRYPPSKRIIKLIGFILTGILCFSLWGLLVKVRELDHSSYLNLSSLLPGLSWASRPYLPSWWVSEGIMSIARSDWLRGGMFWLLTLSTTLVICVAVEWLGSILFYKAWQRTLLAKGRKQTTPVLFVWLYKFLNFLPKDIRAIIMKDIRIFVRDPMQWSQVLIFFGLLGLYFINLRSFHYHLYPIVWQNTITFLNIFSISAVMSSLGSRFIYPQLSLEGHGFWVIGLSPTTATRILITKFITAFIGMFSIGALLIIISVNMLNVIALMRITGFFLISSISLAVCAISTGLGAVFMDLDQRNPVAIVSGFGGTLNLVLNCVFIITVIFPFALMFHLNAIQKISYINFIHGIIISFLWCIMWTSIITVIPLWLGNKSFVKREF